MGHQPHRARIETALLDRSQPHPTAASRGDTVTIDVSAADPATAARQIIALIAAANEIATSRPQ